MNGKRGMGAESYSHCTFKAAWLHTSAADADAQTHTHRHTHRKPLPPLYQYRRTDSHTVGLFVPLDCGPVTGRIWTCVNGGGTHKHRSHAHTQRQTLSIPIHRAHQKKKKKNVRTQLPRTQAQTAKAKSFCVKQMHKAARTARTAAHKNFPQYAHPLSDRSRPQIEPICIFQKGC